METIVEYHKGSFLHAICQKLTCHVVKREKYSLAIYLLLYNKIHGTLMFAVLFYVTRSSHSR